MDSYTRGKRWGYAIYGKNVETFGSSIGSGMSDKAALTCAKYAKTGKKKDKRLSKDEIAFFKGCSDGFLEFYNKNF